MNALIVAVISMIACTCYFVIKNGKSILKPWAWGINILLLIAAAYSFFSIVIFRMQTPAVWDFTAFYLYGKVAASGYNFYNPEYFQVIFNSLNLQFEDFDMLKEEVVAVGFPYPPPTILYFMPLGHLSYNNALIVWSLFNILFVFGSIYLLYSMFLKSEKLNGLLLVLILFFISSQVRSTVSYSQTNFILLFLLLLMKKYEDNPFSGVFLALAIFTKPYMLIFGLYFLLTKKWKAIGYFIVSSIAISLITLMIIGEDTFLSYLTNNSTQRLPAWVFAENINQSLHAVLLRAHITSVDKPMIYMSVALILISISIIYQLYLLKQRQLDHIWAILLLTGLMLYPGTLTYYAVLLLFIIFQFIRKEQSLSVAPPLTIPVIGMFYFLNSASVFAAICFLIIIVVMSRYKYSKFQNMHFLNRFCF